MDYPIPKIPIVPGLVVEVDIPAQNGTPSMCAPYGKKYVRSYHSFLKSRRELMLITDPATTNFCDFYHTRPIQRSYICLCQQDNDIHLHLTIKYVKCYGWTFPTTSLSNLRSSKERYIFIHSLWPSRIRHILSSWT